MSLTLSDEDLEAILLEVEKDVQPEDWTALIAMQDIRDRYEQRGKYAQPADPARETQREWSLNSILQRAADIWERHADDPEEWEMLATMRQAQLETREPSAVFAPKATPTAPLESEILPAGTVAPNSQATERTTVQSRCCSKSENQPTVSDKDLTDMVISLSRQDGPWAGIAVRFLDILRLLQELRDRYEQSAHRMTSDVNIPDPEQRQQPQA